MPNPTYASLEDVHDELLIATTQTTYDQEINRLLEKADSYINMRLQLFTSLPVQTEIAVQLAEIEAKIVAARWKLRRATPQTYNDLHITVALHEDEFQHFLEQNFKTSFKAVGSQDERMDYPYNSGRPGIRNWYDDSGFGGGY